MREDLLCEVRGRVVGPDGVPIPDLLVEFLPVTPVFSLDGQSYCALGACQPTDERGEFSMLLTRTDLTGIQYLTSGALGTYRISLDGPGPHLADALLRHGRRVTRPSR